jgi:ribose 5-phosphate isomerase A
MADPFEDAKRNAGRAAADLVESGMRLGLGTGSTVAHVLDRLGERVAGGLRVAGVPTSEATARRARELGIPLCTFDEVEQLDLAIDGADEVDAEHNLIKGGGGALMREKIVAAAAREMVVVVSANKMVRRVGETFALPVEVLPFGWRPAARALAALGCAPKLRQDRSGKTFETDNRNYVLDCAFGPIADPARLEASILRIPGVLECGLFLGMAGRIVIGEASGEVRMLAP